MRRERQLWQLRVFHAASTGGRLGLPTVLLALLSLFATPPAYATESAAQRLAASYAPVVGFEPEPEACGAGEAYRPTSVDTVLARPGVTLRGPGGRVVKHAPTAADLFGRGEGYYIDLPGNTLEPGCTYEKDFRAWNEGKKPVVYAHVATDAARRGKLAVEYWLFYVFNDFTDKHEGDWELAQVDFDAATPEEALRKGPYQVDVSQHAGGERAEWISSKLEKQGTHPVIYAATGSHANYLGNALYLGRSANEGFGCDDTRQATRRVALRTILLPEVPSSPSSPFAWLSFHGRWGEKEKGINNGPTGPVAKDSWFAPIVWGDGLRDTSVKVPGAKTLGPSVTDFFCGAVKRGSVALNRVLVRPWLFPVVVGVIFAAALAAVRRTTWRPADPLPVRKPRRGGQILRASRRLYRKHWRTFVIVGAVFVPIGIATATAQSLLFHLTPVGDFVAVDGRSGAGTAFIAIFVGSIGAAFAATITTAIVAEALRELDGAGRVRASEAVATAHRHWRALASAFLRQFAVLILLGVTVIGIPFAIYRFVRWSLFAQACVLEERPARASLRRSSELVHGRWWRTFGFTAVVDIVTVLSGPILGVALLLLTKSSLEFINLTGSLVYALTVPLAAIALTLYYFDLEAGSGSARLGHGHP